MATLTVRNIPDDVHRALRLRAAENGRNAEAEARAILEESLMPAGRIRLGNALAELGGEIGLTEDDCEYLDQVRDQTPAKPIEFE